MLIRNLKAFCNVECFAEFAASNITKLAEQGRKVERARVQKKKQALKTKSEHLKECQVAFNRFIRLRDEGEPCISCGRYHQGQYHAGHYRSVGSAPELRFEELNCHLQCTPCNNHLSGNLIKYRVNLIKKLGIEKVEWLEGNHPPKHYQVSEIIELKAHYRKLCRDIEKQQAA
nr:recombination protein NinG [Alteromonas pelagimontana]